MNKYSYLGIHALLWADIVVEYSFFVMQIYLTDVWGLSFTSAATFLNIWGGIHRILPILCLFLSDTVLGNSAVLALSCIFSTTGLVLISVTTGGGYICRKKGEQGECVGHTEKALFITGMALLALGKAARFASSSPFIHEQKDPQKAVRVSSTVVFMVITAFLPLTAFFTFPYIRRWYVVWVVSATFSAIATLLFIYNYKKYYRPGPREEGSPITDFIRVFVASAFNKSQPSPNARLHVINDQEFNRLSSSRFLGFLHKAAIKVEVGDESGTDKRSWRLCSVSEVESAKILIRMVTVYMTYLLSGVVSSIGNTYFVEQATHMTYNIGSWKPPLQLLQIIFMAHKLVPLNRLSARAAKYVDVAHGAGAAAALFSIVCCTVAAAVERRRLHVVRRHQLVDDAVTPMTAFWLLFQVVFLGIVEALFHAGLQQFHLKESPRSMERYEDSMGEGVRGMGYMCGALSVYIVGKVTEIKSSTNTSWFQPTLNRSRLDRYYWVLSILSTFNLGFCILVACNYRRRVNLSSAEDQEIQEEDEDGLRRDGDK